MKAQTNENKEKRVGMKEKYQRLMRQIVDQKYLQNYKNAKVLGENFVGRYYVVIIQIGCEYFVLIENIKEPKLIHLKRLPHVGGYVIFSKQQILINLPKNLYKQLFSNGLYAGLGVARNRNNSQFSIHRLVTCLYQNISGYEIHHIDKNNQNNFVCNLAKLTKKKHAWIDNLPIKEGIKESILEQNRQKGEIFYERRQTLAQNEYLIRDIIKGVN